MTGDMHWENCDQADLEQPAKESVVLCPYAGCEPCDNGCPSVTERACVNGESS